MSHTIYFISGDLSDLQTLLGGLPYGAEVHQLDPTKDGLAEIATVLSGRTEIETLHLLSHGSAGMIQLGTMALYSDNIDSYAATLLRIGTAMSAKGDILLYGCHVAEGEKGQALVDAIARLTHTNVAASTTPTGSAALGGDWNLDVRVGEISSEVLAIENYAGVLVAPTLLSATMKVGSNVLFLNYSLPTATGTLVTSGLPSLSNFSVNLNGTVITPTNLAVVNTPVAALGNIGTVELFLPTPLVAPAAGTPFTVSYTPVYPAGSTDLTTGVIQTTSLAPNDAPVITTALPQAVTVITSTAPVLSTAVLTVGATAAATSALVLTYTGTVAAAAATFAANFSVSIDGTAYAVTGTAIAAPAAAATTGTATLALPIAATAALLAYGTHTALLDYTPPIPVAATLVAPLVDAAQGTAATNTIIQGGTAPAAGATNDAVTLKNQPITITALTAAQLLLGVNAAPVIAGITPGTTYTERTPIAVNAALTVTDSYWNGGTLSASLSGGEAGDTLYLPTQAPIGTSGVWVDAAKQLWYASVAANGYTTPQMIGTASASSVSVAAGATTAALTFTFNANTQPAVGNIAVKSLADSIMFDNPNNYNPSIVARTVTFAATDGLVAGAVAGTLALAAAPVSQVINVTPVNNAPTLTPGLQNVQLIEDGGLANNIPGVPAAHLHLTRADVDSPVVSYDTAVMSAVSGAAGGWVTADGGLTYTHAGTYGTATLTIATDEVSYVLDNTKAATQALKVNQAAQDSFTVQVTDGLLATSAPVVFHITGENDAPTLTAPTAPASLVEAGGIANGTTGVSTATITLSNIDFDSTGGRASYDGPALAAADWTTVDNGVTYSHAGTYGTAILTTATDKVSYVLDNARPSTEALIAGQLVTESFMIQVTDGQYIALTDTVFQITGTNDSPTLKVANQTDQLVEDGGIANGTAGISSTTIALTKGDVDGIVVYDIAGLAAAGWTTYNGGITYTNTGHYGIATLNTATDTVSYLLDNTKPATEALTAGQPAQDSFTIEVTDGTAITSNAAVFHITGTNDVPTLTAGVASTQLVEAGYGVTGVSNAVIALAKGDVDGTASYDTAAMTAARWINNGSTFTKAGTYGTATLTVATDVVSYQLDDTKAATQALKAGEAVTESFTVHVWDTLATTTVDTVFHINGTNDAPTLTAGVASTVLLEAGGTANGTPGVSGATIALTKGDVDGTASYDTAAMTAAGWITADSGLTYTHAGTYGTATLTIASDQVSYALDNARQATEALKGADITAGTPADSVADTFTIHVKDNTGAPATADAVFAITGSDDAPVINPVHTAVATVNEDTLVQITLADMQAKGNATDVDGQISYYTVTGVNNNGTLSIRNVTTNTTAPWVAGDRIDLTHVALWQGNLNLNDVNGNGPVDAFTVTATDNGGLISGPIQETISVTPVNDLPTVSLGTGLTSTFYARNIPVQVVTGNPFINDVEVAKGSVYDKVTKATFTVKTGGIDTLQEHFEVKGDNIVTAGSELRFKLANYDAANPLTYLTISGNNSSTLAINGTATSTQYQDAIKSVYYSNANPNATAGIRSVNVAVDILNGSDIVSENAMTTINAQVPVTVAWAPVIDLDGATTTNVNDRNYTVSYTENSTPVYIASGGVTPATVTDLQSNLQSLTVSLRSGNTSLGELATPLGLEDTLIISLGSQTTLFTTYAITTNVSAHTITFTGNNTGAAFAYALQQVQYQNLSHYPTSALVRYVDVTALGMDGNQGIGAKTTVNIIPVNDLPVLTPGVVIGTIAEGGALNSSGSFAFADFDLDNRPDASISNFSSVSYTGASLALGKSFTLSPAQLAEIQKGFTISPATGNTNNGTINWSYAITNAALDFLGENDHVDATFTVTVDDHNGGKVIQNIVVNIIGQNDIPVITPVDVAGNVAGGINQKLADSGTFNFTDPDLTDVHNLTPPVTKSILATHFAPNAPATPVTLTPAQTLAIESKFQTYMMSDTNSGGTVKWTYLTDSATLTSIIPNRGDRVTAIFTVSVHDSNGGTATQDVTVEISQDAIPVITIVDVAGAVTEGNTVLTDSGSFNFDLNYATDVATFAVAPNFTATSAAGTPLVLSTIQQTALSNAFTTTNQQANGHGSVSWSFAPAETDLNFLAKGEKVNATFTASVDDGYGGVASQNISVVITGTNDAPTITQGKVTGTITEGNIATLTDTGSLSFADSDLSDMVTASAASAVTATKSGGAALVLTPQQIQSISNAFSFTATPGNSGTINWNYAITEDKINFLAQGDTVTATFTVTVDDHNGGTATQDVVVMLNGAKDAPVISGVAPAVTFKVGGGQTPLFDQNLSLALVDNGDQLSRATVTIDTAGALNNRPGDLIPQESIQSNGVNSTLTISGKGIATDPLIISGIGTVAEYKAALQSLYYNNISQSAVPGLRTVSLVVDGTVSAPLSSTVTIPLTVTYTPIVDLNGNNAGQNYTTSLNENISNQIFVGSSTATIQGQQNTAIKTVVMELKNPVDGTNGDKETLSISLAATNALALAGITTSYDSYKHKVTFEALGGASASQFNTAIQAVEYSNNSTNPTRLVAREVFVQATDVNNTEGIGATTTIIFNNPAELPAVTAQLHGTSTTTGGKLSVNDPDGTAQNSFIAQSGIAGSHGTFNLTADGVWNYSLNQGVTTDIQDVFTVQSADFTTSTITVNKIIATGTNSITTAHTTTGVVPISLEKDGSGNSLIDVSAPAAVKFTETQTASASLKDQLLAATKNTNTTDIDNYVQAVTATNSVSKVAVRSITFDANNSAQDVLSINGLISDYTSHQEALVIDATHLLPGTKINLNNVAFAVVVGAAHLEGGEGENYVVSGDNVAKNFALGPGNDTLIGGAGDDTLGSYGGNDLIMGQGGNDHLYDYLNTDGTGNGNDTFFGGDGIDTITFNGKLTDHTITRDVSNPNHYTITDNRPATDAPNTIDGTNQVWDVENFIFSGDTSDSTSPSLPSATGAAVGYAADIVLTFTENVLLGSGQANQPTAGAVTLHEGTATGASVAATVSTSSTGFGNTLTINPTANLLPGTHYVVTLDSGAVHDLAGNNLAAATYSFDTLTTSGVATAYAAPQSNNGAETALIGIAGAGLLAWLLL